MTELSYSDALDNALAALVAAAQENARSALRQDLLAALGEELGNSLTFPEEEASWRRGWNAMRESMLKAINRLLPEEEV